MTAGAMHSMPTTVRLRIRLLGGFRVAAPSADDLPEIEWRPRAAALVKLLALADGYRLHKEQVQETLWPGATPDAAAQSLRQIVYVARRTLDAITPGGGGLLLQQGPRLALAPAAVWVDVDAFEAAASKASRSGDPADYRAALDLYGGDLLPEDRYEDWAAPRREAVRQRFLDLLLEAARRYASRGEHAEAIGALRRAVLHEPTHEGAHAELMRLHALAGDRPAALRQFAQLRTALRRHLDAEPDAATHRLYRAILAREPLPDGPGNGAGGTPSEGSGRPARPGVAEAVDGAGSAVLAPVTHLTGSIKAAGKRRHNLPVPLTSFVGRARERAELQGLLEGAEGAPAARLLTLTGAGGSGKTRLALAVAAELAAAAGGSFPDGVWLAELAAVEDPALAPGAVAAAVGVREAAGTPLSETLAEALREKRLLLVLDNCEHLVEACAALVAALLGRCPGVRVLATSRAALRVPGELAWPLPPLGLPPAERQATPEQLAASEAVQLFVERARLTRPGFALTAQNAPAVAEACRRVDGLPLALELAAARLALLSVEQLAARLTDALRLLAGGGRTVPARQQTLRATIDWSYRLLDARDRTLLARLAVFAGGCTLEAAEAVAAGPAGIGHTPQGPGGDSPDVLEALASLVDKSLLRQERGAEDEPRFVMLETIREYALEHLEASGEAEAVRTQHAAYFAALAERAEPLLRGPQQTAWFARLVREQGNFRQALRWSVERREPEPGLRLAGALGWFWFLRGYPTEAREWLAALLDLAERAGPGDAGGGRAAAQARALSAAAFLAIQQGDYDVACRLDERALAISRLVAHLRGMLTALHGLGEAALWGGNAGRARAAYEEGLALARDGGAAEDVVLFASHLGQFWWLQDDHEAAHQFAERALALARQTGNGSGAAHALAVLGSLAYERGNLRGAGAHLREALALQRDLGTCLGMTFVLPGLAAVAAAQGDVERAARLHGATDALHKRLGITPFPPVQARQEHWLAHARQALTEELYAAARAEGRAMASEEAVAYALQRGACAP
ncbi:MAG TPA: BTAD domain-containing putative transcriptional regulator [Chloroflexota bacterium]|nr:BTAD domain-containing putative transcriptional regulator [Chloroflexota bacterium]